MKPEILNQLTWEDIGEIDLEIGYMYFITGHCLGDVGKEFYESIINRLKEKAK